MKKTKNNSSVDEALRVISEHLAKEITPVILSEIRNELSLTINSEKKEEFITIKDASIHIGIAVQTIYRLVSQHEIPFYKKGKRLYFIKSELNEWIKQGNDDEEINAAELEANKYLYNNKIVA